MAQLDLKKLVQNREEILKAELSMFLHDVGKLHAGHQAKYLYDNKQSDYFHAHLEDRINEACPDISSKFPLRLQQVVIKFPKQQGKDDSFEVSLPQIVACHHRPRKELQNEWNQLDPLLRLATFVDWRDSEYDREGVSSSKICRPRSNKLGVYSALGWLRFSYSWDKIRQEHGLGFNFNDDQFPNIFRIKEALKIASDYARKQLSRENFFRSLRLIFERAAGDTRFSVNDISLWEHSWSTAQIYKSLLSYAFLHSRGLTGVLNDFGSRKLLPQLLPLRIDGLAYLAASNNIPDLLARRALLQEVYDTWQDILEWEFPLAGEVYRDENGSVFLTFLRDKDAQGTIPLSALTLPEDADGFEHVLPEVYRKLFRKEKTEKGEAQRNPTLEDYLREAIVELTQGDLTLPSEIPLHTYTQKRTGKSDEKEKSLGDLLAEEQRQGLWLQADIETIQQAWDQGTGEICSVCGLRPLGFGATNQNNEQKAISRGMCGVCLERRVDRAKTWAQGIPKSPKERLQGGYPETVWLDEVADKNGRLALIVGYFPLEHWLDGTLIETLGMFKQSGAEAPPTNRCVSVSDEQGNRVEVVLGPKPVSYSRIRRVWETTRRFWQDVAPTDVPPKELEAFCKNNGLKLKNLWEQPVSVAESLAGKVIGLAGPRLEIRGIPNPIQQDLGDYHAYELRFPQGVKMAVIWDVQEKRLITAENLIYIASLLGWSLPRPQKNEKEQDYQRRLHEEAAVFVRIKLRQSGTVVLEEPSHYAGQRREIGSFTPEEVKEIPNSTYTPLIPILAEPRTFMALVPADKAVDVVRAIKAKYEREMGRVRNRLPLHLGIVFADAHQPLRTILDAGRRMLRQEAKPLLWEVLCCARKQISKGDELPSRFDSDKNGQFAEWYEVTINTHTRYGRITWYVPAVMGDGKTDDWWYPFVFLERNEKGEPTSQNLYYKAPNPWNSKHPWLVHVSKLQPGDVIYFTPATLDFIFLDHGGRRFEIAYGSDGRRRGTLRRPYLLDELDDLVACWELLAGKEDGQHKIRRLSSRQLHIVRDLIENKRTEWFVNPLDSVNNETFRHFCESVLRNAEWQTKPETEFERLTHWAATGLLADAVELFYHILKQRPAGEEE